MVKFQAVFFGLIIWPFFPVRWWEGKPLIAIALMVTTSWFICAGKMISPLFYAGAIGIVLFELVTIPKRVERETKRMARTSND